MRLILLSAQRSGTNWLMDVLGRVPGVLCLRDAFNPRGVFGAAQRGGLALDAASHAFGVDGRGERDPALVDVARGNPERFLDVAEAAASARGLTWLGATVFPGHLPEDRLGVLLRRPGTVPVVLRRRQLDRAVSYAKARRIGAWRGVDTTGQRPEVDLRMVVDQLDLARQWFRHVGRLTAGLPAVRLTYEDHVLGGAERALAAVAGEVRDFPWEPGDPVPKPGLARQDITEDPFARVANGEALRADLAARGLLDQALRLPALAG